MYTNTSEAYKARMKMNSRQEFIKGTIGPFNFDSTNLLSLSYSNRCSEEGDLTLGSVYIGQLDAEFINTGIERGQWNEEEIVLQYGLATLSSGVSSDDSIGLEFIPAGHFKIASAQWSKKSVKVVAYDVVSKLDKTISITSINGTPFELMKFACEQCQVKLATTEEEFKLMPNGQEVFGLNPENDLKTWRDFSSKVAQLVGGFVSATRNGTIQVQSFSNVSIVDEIGADGRLQDSTFSDFTTKYIGISMVERTTGATIDVTNGNHSGSLISIGDNPFLTYGLEATKDRQRNAIAASVKNFKFTPFATSLLTNPAYDLADGLVFVGGSAGDRPANGIIMAIDWTFHQTIDLRGFGADPNLGQAESRTEKASAGAAATARGESLNFYTYANATPLNIGSEKTRVSKITFVNTKETNMETWTQIQLQTELESGNEYMEVKATMILDGETISFAPTERFNDNGLHLFHLLWTELLTDTSTHTWEVYLETNGGTITIENDNLRTIIKGQGISAKRDWDGFIDVEEQIPTSINGLQVSTDFVEEELFAFFVPLSIEASDEMNPANILLEQDAIEEGFSILLEIGVYDLITEEGENFITEEGDKLQSLGG